jgi:hypothetical protein
MRGRFRTWTRIRINLQHVPESLQAAAGGRSIPTKPLRGSTLAMSEHERQPLSVFGVAARARLPDAARRADRLASRSTVIRRHVARARC